MRALVVLVALSSAIAHAQPPGLTPPSEPRRRAPKDRSSAALFSLAGTLAPILVAPQVGKSDYPEATLALGTAGAAVTEWNRKLELAPTAMRVDRGQGVGLAGRF
jgi:hypothetical protein